MLVQSKGENIVHIHDTSVLKLSIAEHAGPTNALTSIDLHSFCTLVQLFYFIFSQLIDPIALKNNFKLFN